MWHPHGGQLHLEPDFYRHFQPMDREPGGLEQRRNRRLGPGQRPRTRLGLRLAGLRRGQRLGIPDLPPLALSVGSPPARPDDAQRPYRKNDQAHVEQKNWTHVRQLLGYQRLEQPELVPLINELYRTWGLLHNFFCPSLKLLSKTRKGARTIRKYSLPQTPYQRLMECEHLSQEQKQKLENQFQQLNPLQLKREIEQQLKLVLNRV